MIWTIHYMLVPTSDAAAGTKVKVFTVDTEVYARDYCWAKSHWCDAVAMRRIGIAIYEMATERENWLCHKNQLGSQCVSLTKLWTALDLFVDPFHVSTAAVVNVEQRLLPWRCTVKTWR